MVRARVLGVVLVGLILIVAGLAYYVATTGAGTIAIRVRDVPASWSHVTLAFSEVRAHRAGATNDSGWIDIDLSVAHVDFLAPGNETSLVALGPAPPGTYGEVEVGLSSVVGIPTSGSAVTMVASHGILVLTPFTLRGSSTTTMTIDLNLVQSIHQANGTWVFTPVVGDVIVT